MINNPQARLTRRRHSLRSTLGRLPLAGRRQTAVRPVRAYGLSWPAIPAAEYFANMPGNGIPLSIASILVLLHWPFLWSKTPSVWGEIQPTARIIPVGISRGQAFHQICQKNQSLSQKKQQPLQMRVFLVVVMNVQHTVLISFGWNCSFFFFFLPWGPSCGLNWVQNLRFLAFLTGSPRSLGAAQHCSNTICS